MILKLNVAMCGESEKSPGEWKSYPFQFSDLDNPMDCKNHGTAKSLTRLSAYKIPFLSKKKKNLFFYHFSDWHCLWTPKEWEEVDKEED